MRHKTKKRLRKRKRLLVRRLRGVTRPVRHALEGFAINLLLRGVTRLSHESALTWGRRAGRLVGSIARREKAILCHNLELAFGNEMTAEQRNEMARSVFESLGMLAFEAAHSIHWIPDDYHEKVAIEGEEHLREAQTRGKGVLLVSGHFGNWELMHPAFLCHTGIVAGIVSRDVSNPSLNERITAFRGRMGNPIYSTERSAIAYMRLLRKGGALAMLADQDSDRIRSETIQFFGRPALTPIGPGFLSHKCGTPIVPIFIRRCSDDATRHRMKILPPIFPDPSSHEKDDARRLIQEITLALEQEIRGAPEQWAWIHDRWHRTHQWKALREEKNQIKGKANHE